MTIETKRLNKNLKFASELKIAGILDALSENFFPYECNFLNLGFNNWNDQIKKFKPDILFVESVWDGFKKTWRNKLTPTPSPEFLRLIQWCRDNGVPTIFWNKEDPIHFTTFLHVASLFDYVLTTDMDCVPLYKRLLGHEQVYCMPFASCVQLYSPIEKYERIKGACFAGSYYNKREERKRDFESIIDSLVEKNWKVDIYDRNPYPNDPDYVYPKKYQKYIIGSLPPSQVDIAYKSYEVGITLNIVKHSSTMEARRAFELLSCNTLVISNECQGLKNLFGDLIIHYDNSQKFQLHLDQILNNPLLLEKTKLLALRKVLQEHTYKERVEFLYEIVYKEEIPDNSPVVGVYSVVKDILSASRVVNSYRKQKYDRKKLFLFSDEWEQISREIEQTADISVLPMTEFNEGFLNNMDYCAYFDENHYYGASFLVDLMLALKYEPSCTAIGKGAYYTFGKNAFELKNNEKRYKLISSLQANRSIVSVEYKKHMGFYNEKESSVLIEGVTCLSIDPFNFCEYYKFDTCNLVDDISIDQGLSMKEINDLGMSIEASEQYFSFTQSISKEQLFNLTRAVSDKIDKIRTINNDTALFTVKKILGTQQIALQRNFEVSEHSNKEDIIFIYLNSLTIGDSRFICSFYDSQDNKLGSYQLLPFGCTAVRKKANSTYFKFSIEVSGDSQIILKELILNPRPKESILV